jgi:hypothetical protein
MKNQSVSDFVAAEMDAVLNSKEHKSLFATQYKKAAAQCSKCHKDHEECMCDSAMADDDKDSSLAWDADDNDARKTKKRKEEETDQDTGSADDENDAHRKAKKDTDSSDADDEDDASDGDSMQSSAAYEVAVDSLLTASAALDSLGFDRGSVFTLKIASLVVEAKKKEEKKKSDKKKGKFPFQKGKDSKKSDSQSAKDKKSAPKKDDKKSPKKSDSKSTSSSSSKKK